MGARKAPPSIKGFNLFFMPNLNECTKVAIYISNKIRASIISQASNSHCITCSITTSNGENIFVSSVYSPPPDSSPSIRLKRVLDNLSHRDISKTVIGADLNAHSNLWSNSSMTDSKGEDVENIVLQHNMLVINSPYACYKNSHPHSYPHLKAVEGEVGLT